MPCREIVSSDEEPFPRADGSLDWVKRELCTWKVHACDVTEMVCNRAMDLMGSYGYVREYHVEKYLRDSKIIQLWLGGNHLARLDVAQSYYPYTGSK